MLTLTDLKEMQPGVFASGFISFDEIHRVKWVAVRGNIHDWAIYVGDTIMTINDIKRGGTKIYDMNKIKKVVKCTDEALNMYRL